MCICICVTVGVCVRVRACSAARPSILASGGAVQLVFSVKFQQSEFNWGVVVYNFMSEFFNPIYACSCANSDTVNISSFDMCSTIKHGCDSLLSSSLAFKIEQSDVG